MALERRSPAVKSFAAQLRTNIRGYLVRGLLVIIPVVVTLYVLVLCYRLTAAHLTPFVKRYVLYIPERLESFLVPAIAVIFFLSFLYLIGFLTAWVAGRRLIALGESFIHYVPIVKTIYNASKQAVEVLNVQNQSVSYEAAVFIDFPYVGCKTIAFVTGKTEIEGEGLHYRLFVPTTPNPTSGYFLLYPVSRLELTGMPVQDAVKAVMSAGIVTPEILNLKPGMPSTAHVEVDATERAAAEQARAAREITVWGKVRHLLRTRMLSGFFVLVPLGITAFVVNLIYAFTAGRITPLSQATLRALPTGPRLVVESFTGPLHQLLTAAVSVVLFFVLLYATGYIATAVVGARLIRLGERIIDRIPLVTSIYSATKQIAEGVLFQKEGPNLKLAVFAEFPYRGTRALGFVVGTQRTATGKLYYKLFVPTSPNVTVGLLQFYEASDLSTCSMDVEEAIKMVVSGGIIGPSHLQLRRLDQYTQEEIQELLAGPPEE